MKNAHLYSRFAKRRFNWRRAGFLLFSLVCALLAVAGLVVAGHFILKYW